MVVCNRSYLLSIIDFVIVLYHLIDGILSNVCMMSEYWITEAEEERGWYEKSIKTGYQIDKEISCQQRHQLERNG